jgi:hypothetical protein
MFGTHIVWTNSFLFELSGGTGGDEGKAKDMGMCDEGIGNVGYLFLEL